MEDFAIRDDEVYTACCRVQNTFIELIPLMPSLARHKSAPSVFRCENSPPQRCKVPVDHVGDAAGKTDSDAGTCVIVRDLPCKVGNERMLLELERLGLGECYESIIFPYKKESHNRMSFRGYGFIYFVDEEAAFSFISKFENHHFEDINSPKLAHVELARTAGIEMWRLLRSSQRARSIVTHRRRV
eukprot:TRINITY_DN14605_c0_g2_i1.p1 TRINITY_DN14605_c0_g2~~TRINITY_DN14605_c0_g2_i1.p1  ORF type:complete len:186 (-),score=27.48 TRINITY_DN14605_c0_g2_i1:397-954(-)